MIDGPQSIVYDSSQNYMVKMSKAKSRLDTMNRAEYAFDTNIFSLFLFLLQSKLWRYLWESNPDILLSCTKSQLALANPWNIHNVPDMSQMQCLLMFLHFSIIFVHERYNFFYQVIPNSNIHDLANRPREKTSTHSTVLLKPKDVNTGIPYTQPGTAQKLSSGLPKQQLMQYVTIPCHSWQNSDSTVPHHPIVDIWIIFVIVEIFPETRKPKIHMPRFLDIADVQFI